MFVTFDESVVNHVNNRRQFSCPASVGAAHGERACRAHAGDPGGRRPRLRDRVESESRSDLDGDARHFSGLLFHVSPVRVAVASDVLIRLEREGAIPHEPSPLGLPKHTIRILIVLTFGGLGAYLYREGRLLEPQVLSIFGTALCYLLGVFISGFTAWWSKGHKTLASHVWEDIKAVVVLLTVGATATLYFVGGPGR